MIVLIFTSGGFSFLLALLFVMWFFGHGGDWDTPYKRGRDGWKLRASR